MEPAKPNTVRWWLERIADDTIRKNTLIGMKCVKGYDVDTQTAHTLGEALMRISWDTSKINMPSGYFTNLHQRAEDIKLISPTDYIQSFGGVERVTFNPCSEMLIIPNGKWAIKGPINKDEAILKFFKIHSKNYLSGESTGHYSYDPSRIGNASRTYNTNEEVPSDFTIITKEEWHEIYDDKSTIVDEVRNKMVGGTLYGPNGLPEIWIIAAPIRDTAIAVYLLHYSPKLDVNRSTGYYGFNSKIKSGSWNAYPGNYKSITLNDFLKAQQSQSLKPQNSHEHKQISGNTVKAQRPTATVSRGQRATGRIIPGKEGRTTTERGHLIHRSSIGH